MSEQLSQDSREFAVRGTAAGLYSQVMLAVSRSRLTVEKIALRIGRDPARVRQKFRSARGWTLADVSDFLLAVNCEPEIRITDSAKVNREEL